MSISKFSIIMAATSIVHCISELRELPASKVTHIRNSSSPIAERLR